MTHIRRDLFDVLAERRSEWTPHLPPAWTVDALCAQTDAEAFFPGKGESVREAKRVCSACLVTAPCLKYALDNDERFGVWGNASERERRRMKREAA